MRDITARKEREAILAEERGRIARDLHDGVAQTLYFLALKGDMARQQIIDKSEQVANELKELSQTARRVIRDVRRTIYALRPLEWTEGQFLPELSRFVSGYAEQMGWQTVIEFDDAMQLPNGHMENDHDGHMEDNHGEDDHSG